MLTTLLRKPFKYIILMSLPNKLYILLAIIYWSASLSFSNIPLEAEEYYKSTFLDFNLNLSFFYPWNKELRTILYGHPGLYQLFNFIVFQFTNITLFKLRFISSILFFTMLSSFYFLCLNFYQEKKWTIAVFLGAIFFCLNGQILFRHNNFYGDSMLYAWIALGAISYIKNYKKLALAFSVLGVLTKFSALCLPMTFLFYEWRVIKNRNFRDLIPWSIPFSIVAIYMAINYHIDGTLSQNPGYKEIINLNVGIQQKLEFIYSLKENVFMLLGLFFLMAKFPDWFKRPNVVIGIIPSLIIFLYFFLIHNDLLVRDIYLFCFILFCFGFHFLISSPIIPSIFTTTKSIFFISAFLLVSFLTIREDIIYVQRIRESRLFVAEFIKKQKDIVLNNNQAELGCSYCGYVDKPRKVLISEELHKVTHHIKMFVEHSSYHDIEQATFDIKSSYHPRRPLLQKEFLIKEHFLSSLYLTPWVQIFQIK